MEYNELLLKTAFCTMACDGDIANPEIQYVKNFANELQISNSVDIEKTLNNYVNEINQLKQGFLNKFIQELSEQELSLEQEIQLAKISIEMILADNLIKYSEIRFFKRICSKLHLSDEQIRDLLPEDSDDPNLPTQEDFLSEDIVIEEDIFGESIIFEDITLNDQLS